MDNTAQTLKQWKYLHTIGASWFVSFCYYFHIDKNHLNWVKSKTAPTRVATFMKTKQYHKLWLGEVLNMSASYLDTNKIDLSGEKVKIMAQELLDILT